MQTFLTHTGSLTLTARSLDKRRLWKQVIEAGQILSALHFEQYKIYTKLNVNERRVQVGWQSHAATRMWRGYEGALATYHDVMLDESLRRGINTQRQFLVPFGIVYSPPWWMVDLKVFRSLVQSHRSSLVGKNPEFYRPLFPRVPENLPYVWPVQPWQKRKALWM